MAPGVFTQVRQRTPAKTGRSAHVSNLATANSRDGALRVIKELQDDLAGTGASEWENTNLERFLDGYDADRGQQPSAQPDWSLFATALAAAAGYTVSEHHRGRRARLARELLALFPRQRRGTVCTGLPKPCLTSSDSS